MRGKERVVMRSRGTAGITPAYAGKSTGRSFPAAAPWDHPRVCGEKYHGCMLWLTRRGSPPRMRGKELSFVGFQPHTGITPAYAGKSPSTAIRPLCMGDHPRVCGEKADCAPFAEFEVGSPPRMRGKDHYILCLSFILRITPAYAGKSHRFRYRPAARLDHPRVCGEKFSTPPQLVIRLGSPPRMRGKAGIKKDKGVAARITPAYAGKSFVVLRCYADKGDHPRVCGEKHIVQKASFDPDGSPPRMRGKANIQQFNKFSTRITPAYAGKRQARWLVKV